jgi:hypothetical protein
MSSCTALPVAWPIQFGDQIGVRKQQGEDAPIDEYAVLKVALNTAVSVFRTYGPIGYASGLKCQSILSQPLE